MDDLTTSLVISKAILDKINSSDYVVNIVRVDSDNILISYKSGREDLVKLPEIGAKGDKGDKGDDGKSIKGDKGDKGDDGKSIKGDKGDKGDDGKSIKGDKGDKGDDGKSIKGDKGDKGNNGKSIKGDKGDKGNNGKSIKGDKGEDGKEGNGIISIKIDVAGNLIIVTRDKTFNLGRIKFSGGGGGFQEFTYSNNLPMPNDVGGIPAGTTFDKVKLKDLWTRLLYSYGDPIFTDFSIDGINPVLEIGEHIIAGIYNVNWVIDNPEMLTPNSISVKYINDNTTLASGLANTGLASIPIPEIFFNVSTSIKFKIEATNTMGEILSKELNISVKPRVYVGESYLAVLNPFDVVNLRFSELANNIDGEYAMLAGGYKWFCYPSSWGERHNFYDVNTGLSIPMSPPWTVLVTNSYGVEVSYYTYRTYNTLGGSLTIGVR